MVHFAEEIDVGQMRIGDHLLQAEPRLLRGPDGHQGIARELQHVAARKIDGVNDGAEVAIQQPGEFLRTLVAAL